MKELITCFLSGIKHRHKYPKIVREFCLNIYHASVKAYEVIRFFFNNNLPHPATIRSWYANSDLNCDPGISQSCVEILKKRAIAMKDKGIQLMATLAFDEMHIKQNFQWCNTSREMIGFTTYGTDALNPDDEKLEDLNLDEAANQVIVLMAIGINDHFKLPIAYHFIKRLGAEDKAELVLSAIDSLNRAGVVVPNISFDGHSSNKRMCTLLGANLKLSSDQFQPYFLNRNGDRVYIIFDVPHMEKLVRNILSDHKKLFDSDGGVIEWKFYEDLVQLSKTDGFDLTHKMTKAHIQWRNKKMRVELAVQTFSKSTAESLEFLRKEGHPKFLSAAATIKLTELFDNLFDIFNTKHNSMQNENPFKQPLSASNKDEIFEYFRNAIEYIQGLRIKNETGAVTKLVTSRQNTGFKGFVVNMHSLKGIYSKYIEQEKFAECIPTYSLTQDAVEIFFGKNR